MHKVSVSIPNKVP